MLRFSFMQNIIAHYASGYLSEKLKTEVTVGAVDVTFFLNISLEDIVVKDKHNNSLIDASDIVIDLDDIYFADNLIIINKIEINNALIQLVKYENEKELNFQFIIDAFSSSDTNKNDTSKAWKIRVSKFGLEKNHFIYHDRNKKAKIKGIDFDYLDLTNLNLNMSNFNLHGDTMFTFIESLSCKDHSGFEIKSFSSLFQMNKNEIDFYGMKLKTKGSSVFMNMGFEINDYNDFNDFVNKVKLNAKFGSSVLDISDLAYFATDLWGMDSRFFISGELKGMVSKIKGKNFILRYGNQTNFYGDFSITGLPNVNETFIKLNVKGLSASFVDMAALKLPSEGSPKYMTFSPELLRLGIIKFKGHFTGFYNDFVANGDFNTNLGSVATDLSLRKNKDSGQLEYNGNVKTSGFDIGTALGIQDQLGSISMNADIKGSGIDPKTAVLDINGTIYSVKFKNYDYKNVTLAGTLDKQKFVGNANVSDENIQITFNGNADLSGSLPVYNLNADIKRLRLSKLNFLRIKEDSLAYFTGFVKMNFTGNTIDNIQGSIVAENTEFYYKRKKYILKNFEFINTALPDGNKSLTVNSDFFDAELKGNFMFEDLYLSFLKFSKDYLPSFSKDIKENLDSIPEENFTYKILVKNIDPLCQIFIPELKVAKNTILKGSYNTLKSNLEINFTSARLDYSDKRIEDFFLSGKTENSRININFGCERIIFADSVGLDNVIFKSITQRDSTMYSLYWNNNNTNTNIKNSGDIIGITSFYHRPRIETKLLQANFVINDTAWVLNPNNYLIVDSNNIFVQDYVFSTQWQQLKINGTLSENPADIMNVNFKAINISDFDFIIGKNNDVDIDGYINGDLIVSNVYKAPLIQSNLKIDDFYINGDRIGKAEMVSTWDNNIKALSLNVNLIYEGSIGSNIPVTLKGYYYTDREKDNFDMDIELKNFKLKLLERYISTVSSNFKGYATGNLKLRGTPEDPDLSGMLYLIVKGFRVDYLNTNYSFTDSVEVTKNAFIFDHTVLNDSRGDTAIFDGKIMHERFYDFFLDFTFKPYNFECLNTNSSQNSLFYGKAYTTGIFKIYGNVNNIVMDISAKTEKGTQFNIPISDGTEIYESDYITFNSKYQDLGTKVKANAGMAGITLNFDLDITNDAAIQIIFDSKIGDIIKAKGSGNIIMKINTLGDFNMYGEYVINEGDYLFTLQNVINKKFVIQKGSTITFNGSPYEANADISAVYSVKTALYDLFPVESDMTEKFKKREIVECQLTMKDKLMNPSLTFDINLPNSDESTITLVKSVINNEQEMNRQIFSLLVLNRFMTPENIQYSALGSGFGSTSSELLSNQLSNWLSQISKSFDIGVNYRPGTEISKEELEIALSTQLFNDKLTIDGNVGVSGAQANKSSNIVGDVNVDYKITNDGRLRVKGFNRSNAVDLLNTNSPYTQGLGVFYRREFDSFNELFIKKPKK